jgi:hypothetical protein
VDKKFIDNMIFDIYLRLMDDYDKYKSLIPPDNLMEIRFEEFEKTPVKKIEDIYINLLKEDFSQIQQYFSDYFKTQKGHKKNKYLVEAAEIEQIKKHWKEYIERYNYSLPDDITIKPNVVI